MPVNEVSQEVVAQRHPGPRLPRAHTLSVVVPAMDEEESLPLLVARVLDVCASSGLKLSDIVLVDDGSRDKTWAVMTRLAEDNTAVQAIKLRRNFGKATALMVGIGA